MPPSWIPRGPLVSCCFLSGRKVWVRVATPALLWDSFPHVTEVFESSLRLAHGGGAGVQSISVTSSR